MRHKRAKTYKRAISIYTTAFGFRQPFQVLVSNDILLALNRESDIHKQLSACCQGEIKPMITQCCIEALYALGKDSQAVVNIAKEFERRRCNHRTAIAPDDCLKDVVGETNKHRYVLSAQSLALRNAVANVPGLPIIHFNARGVLVLSPPSRATLKHKDAQEEARRLEGADALAGVEDGENVVGAGTASNEPVKRNRAKGPNPLSMKKKKTVETGSKREEKVEEVEQARKKKNRKRGKGLVKQVKEEIEAERAAEAARGEASAKGSDGGDGADDGMESD